MEVDDVCLLCNSEAETCGHLFFQCQYSCLVWKHVLISIGKHHNPRRWELEQQWLMREAVSRNHTSKKLRWQWLQQYILYGRRGI